MPCRTILQFWGCIVINSNDSPCHCKILQATVTPPSRRDSRTRTWNRTTEGIMSVAFTEWWSTTSWLSKFAGIQSQQCFECFEYLNCFGSSLSIGLSAHGTCTVLLGRNISAEWYLEHSPGRHSPASQLVPPPRVPSIQRWKRCLMSWGKSILTSMKALSMSIWLQIFTSPKPTSKADPILCKFNGCRLFFLNALRSFQMQAAETRFVWIKPWPAWVIHGPSCEVPRQKVTHCLKMR